MKKRILVDSNLLNTYMKYIKNGDVEPNINSFLTYQNAVQKAIQAEKISKIKPAEDKTTYKINVNERLDFNHTYIVELPADVNDEEVWNKIDNCTGTGKISDINLIIEQYGGAILDVDVDITPTADIEIDEVEVIAYGK